MISLRSTIFGWLATLLAVVGLVTSFRSYAVVQREWTDLLDNQQRQLALYVSDGSASPMNTAIIPPHETEDDFAIKVSYHDGRPERNSGLSVRIPMFASTGFAQFRDDVAEWRVFTLIGADRTTQVAQQVNVRQELTKSAALQAILPIALTIPLSWLVLHIIVGRIIGRLNVVAFLVQRRQASDASPIPTAEVPIEMVPLVEAMNRLLVRLRVAMERQHQFVADAAHELRTPLGALLIQIGNLSRAIGDGPLADRVADLERGARRAALLTAQLLRLASYDASGDKVVMERLNLDMIALSALAQLMPLATERSVNLGLAHCDRAAIQGNGTDYRVLIENILDNAVRYTPSGGSVDLAVFSAVDAVIIEIKDTGPGIPQESMDNVFERFFRAAPQDIEGSGLGLPIAKAIAARYGISIALANRRDRLGLIVRLTFSTNVGSDHIRL